MNKAEKQKLRELAFSHITRESIKKGCMQAKNGEGVPNGFDLKKDEEWLNWAKEEDKEFADLDIKELKKDKPNYALLPQEGLYHTCLALMDGASKYGEYNWRWKKDSVSYMEFLRAIMGHTLSFIEGEEVASDSLVSHLGHIGARCVILMDAIKCGNAVDDRPIPHMNKE